MSGIVKKSQNVLSKQILNEIDRGSFFSFCRESEIDKNVAIGTVISDFPSKKEEILKRLISETDSNEINLIHLGNYNQKREIIENLEKSIELSDGKKKYNLLFHSLIFGDPGVGKTSFVLSLGLKYDLINLNASNIRNYDEIVEEIAGSTTVESLDGKPRIIFFDEIDSMSDSGYKILQSFIGPGAAELEEVFSHVKKDEKLEVYWREKYASVIQSLKKRSRFPMIMACNNLPKVKEEIRSNDRVKIFEFAHPEQFEIESFLDVYSASIWDSTDPKFSVNLRIDEKEIKRIASECDGDVRLAKKMMLGGKKYEKEVEYSVPDLVYAIFTMKDRHDVYDILMRTDFSPNVLFSHISINIRRYYNKLSMIIDSFEILSAIDSVKYKTKKEYYCSVLAFGFKPSPFIDTSPIQPPRGAYKIDKKLRNSEE